MKYCIEYLMFTYINSLHPSSSQFTLASLSSPFKLRIFINLNTHPQTGQSFLSFIHPTTHPKSNTHPQGNFLLFSWLACILQIAHVFSLSFNFPIFWILLPKSPYRPAGSKTKVRSGQGTWSWCSIPLIWDKDAWASIERAYFALLFLKRKLM